MLYQSLCALKSKQSNFCNVNLCCVLINIHFHWSLSLSLSLEFGELRSSFVVSFTFDRRFEDFLSDFQVIFGLNCLINLRFSFVLFVFKKISTGISIYELNSWWRANKKLTFGLEFQWSFEILGLKSRSCYAFALSDSWICLDQPLVGINWFSMLQFSGLKFFLNVWFVFELAFLFFLVI